MSSSATSATTRSAASTRPTETSAGLRAVVEGGRVSLLVTESVLPDASIFAAIGEWRDIVPTARRIVAAHWSRFRDDADALRPGMDTGKYDAYLLMPRGVHDEEFHTAITELLSDWGSTVADPEVPSTTIITDGDDPLVVAIRDFLDRMGMASRTRAPDSDVGRDVLAQLAETVDPADIVLPVVAALSRVPIMARSVRDLSTTICGNPADIDVD